jgi:hypothetical protein
MGGIKIPDGSSAISRHFVWKDALYLPTWSRMAQLSDGLTELTLSNLKAFFQTMDLVRDFFAAPIFVHVAYRPKAYNHLVGGAENSTHIAQLPGEAAVDFHVQGVSCDQARERILKDGKLEEWKLRMEKNPGSDWVHLDCRVPAPGHARYFVP